MLLISQYLLYSDYSYGGIKIGKTKGPRQGGHNLGGDSKCIKNYNMYLPASTTFSNSLTANLVLFGLFPMPWHRKLGSNKVYLKKGTLQQIFPKFLISSQSSKSLQLFINVYLPTMTEYWAHSCDSFTSQQLFTNSLFW